MAQDADDDDQHGEAVARGFAAGRGDARLGRPWRRRRTMVLSPISSFTVVSDDGSRMCLDVDVAEVVEALASPVLMVWPYCCRQKRSPRQERVAGSVAYPCSCRRGCQCGCQLVRRTGLPRPASVRNPLFTNVPGEGVEPHGVGPRRFLSPLIVRSESPAGRFRDRFLTAASRRFPPFSAPVVVNLAVNLAPTRQARQAWRTDVPWPRGWRLRETHGAGGRGRPRASE